MNRSYVHQRQSPYAATCGNGITRGNYRLYAEDLDDMGCEFGNSAVLGVVIPVRSPGYQEQKAHGKRIKRDGRMLCGRAHWQLTWQATSIDKLVQLGSSQMRSSRSSLFRLDSFLHQSLHLNTLILPSCTNHGRVFNTALHIWNCAFDIFWIGAWAIDWSLDAVQRFWAKIMRTRNCKGDMRRFTTPLLDKMKNIPTTIGVGSPLRCP
jgi:hypothetical protein